MFCWLVVPCATLFLHTRHPLVRSLRPLSSRTDFLRSAKRGKSFFSKRWKAFRVINPQSRIQRVELCNLNFFSPMKLTLMWQSCIIYPFNWGSFKYSSRVIFPSAPVITICWYFSRAARAALESGASWISFSGWTSASRYFFLLASPMCMAWERYITSFSPRTEEKSYRLAFEARINLHYNEFSWTFGCVCIRFCCFLFTNNNIFNTFCPSR